MTTSLFELSRQNPSAPRIKRVAVIGLGYVGLPLAVTFAQAGYQVTGIDVDRRKVTAINSGESYIEDIPRVVIRELVLGPNETGNLTQDLTFTQRVSQSSSASLAEQPITYSARSRQGIGRLQATSDFAALAECDAVSICVPTPLSKTGDPDLSYIVAAAEAVARYLHPGMVIVLESTTYPGTTTEVVLPILLRGNQRTDVGSRESDGADPQLAATINCSPLTIGVDFFLAFSPERVDPGRTDWVTRNTPKVIGGVTPACLQAAMAYYGAALESLVPVSSPAAAEMTKLFENTFRMVNIGLANELLLMCEKLDLDAWEVLEAAATKPFGFMKFTPGPGLGGHCIPIDPHYLSWKLRSLHYNARFIELASEINTAMPRYWVQQVQNRLNEAGKAVKGSRILLLGVAYKKDVSDLRESPALDIIHLLEAKGAIVHYHDPYIPAFQHEGMEMVGVTDLTLALRLADCVVITTDHTNYDWPAIVAQAQLLIDTRRASRAVVDPKARSVDAQNAASAHATASAA